MRITVVYGFTHKKVSYEVTRQLLKYLGNKSNDVAEIFLPRDMDVFCTGCCLCFFKGEETCPHYEMIYPIQKSIEKSDLLIFVTPVYALHTTGQMKALLDHFSFQFIPHRPNETMFTKKAVILSTTAGAGTRSAIKDIKDSLSFWGVGKIFTYGKAIQATSWQEVSELNKKKIEKDMKGLAERILKQPQRVKPNLKAQFLFYMVRWARKKAKDKSLDTKYWEEKGWLKDKRPW